MAGAPVESGLFSTHRGSLLPPQQQGSGAVTWGIHAAAALGGVSLAFAPKTWCPGLMAVTLDMLPPFKVSKNVSFLAHVSSSNLRVDPHVMQLGCVPPASLTPQEAPSPPGLPSQACPLGSSGNTCKSQCQAPPGLLSWAGPGAGAPEPWHPPSR